MFLHFRAQVSHLIGRVLQLGSFISGTDVRFAGVLRHPEDCVRIEHWRINGDLALSTSFFLLSPALVLLSSSHTRFLFLFLPQPRLLFLTRLLSALLLFMLTVSAMRLLFRPLLIRALRCRTPHSFCGLTPAFVAQVPRFCHVPA